MSSFDQSNGDVFGQILSASQLEQAAIDLIRDWLPTYIVEMSAQIGWAGNTIPAPRSYTTRNFFTRFAEDQLPQLIVVSPGLAGKPVKDGTGTFRATWGLGVGIVCSAKDESSTKALARFYCACIRGIMVQHRSLEGFASNLEWTDEAYDDIHDEEDTARSLASGVCTFNVEVEGVVSWHGGPRVPLAPIPSGTEGDLDAGRYPNPDPNTQPGSTYPTVTSADITLQKEAL